MTVQGDVAVWDDVARVAEDVVGHFGRIDVLVNNVGDMAATQMSWRELTPEASSTRSRSTSRARS